MIEKIISSIGWPQASLIVAILIIICFYAPIKAFLWRVTKVGKDGVTTETLPAAQNDGERKKAVDELMNIGDSIVRNELEQLIIKDLATRGIETQADQIKVLTRQLAFTQLSLDYEQIYTLIFGSQISLLKRLNDVVGQGRSKDYMDDYFSKVKVVYQEFNAWSLDQYLDFLFKRNLITNVNGKYHTTNKGVDFLIWMVRNGRAEDRGF